MQKMGRSAKIHPAIMPVILIDMCFKRNRQRRNASLRRLHGSPDRPGDGDAGADIFTVIDPRYRQVNPPPRQVPARHALPPWLAFPAPRTPARICSPYWTVYGKMRPSCSESRVRLRPILVCWEAGAAINSSPSGSSAAAAAASPGEAIPSSLVTRIKGRVITVSLSEFLN